MSIENSIPYHKQSDSPDSIKNMSQEELLFYSIDYFHHSLEKRQEMSATTALWTNRVIRSGMFGLMLIATSILILVIVVSEQMGHVASMMLKIDQHMELIVKDTRQMAHYVDAIGGSVATLPPIVDQISTMETSVHGINENITIISERMENADRTVDNIVNDIEHMETNLDSVSRIVERMDQSINKVSQPFRLFNRMVPLP